MSDLTIGTRTSTTCIVLMLAGDLDVESATALRRALLEAVGAGVGAVTVDLEKLRLCDSVGISTLIFGYRQAGLHGVAYSVINARGTVADLLQIARVADVLCPSHGARVPPPDHRPARQRDR